MKKVLLSAIIAIVVSNTLLAQSQYEVMVERPNEKTWKGIISREAIMNDTFFMNHWYTANQNYYTPNPDAVAGLKRLADTLQLLVFMGTWCEDSQFIIPKLFKLADVSGFPASRITLVGVDRNKKTLSHLCEALNVTNVPTIMVMKDGKEMGRVVEYGKSGSFDKDLAEILTAARN
jgi:thiol-disulfide isomerase/thioredoxin